jgi:tetratricopeptide (TPR) repeat protein
VAESRIEELRRRVGRDPGSRLFGQLAEEERKAGNLSEAIRIARAGLAVHPAYPAALLTLGRALVDSGDGAAARTALEEALKQAPDNILASRFLGAALEALGELQGALQRYRATLEMTPGDSQLAERVQSLEARVAAGPQEQAAAPVVPAFPGAASTGATPAGAPVAGRERDTTPAGPRAASAETASAEEAETEEPPFSSSTLAELYLRQGFLAKALEVYRKVVAERPSDGKARLRLAELTSQLGPEGGAAAPDAQEARRRALQRTIAGLEVLLGMARRR